MSCHGPRWSGNVQQMSGYGHEMSGNGQELAINGLKWSGYCLKLTTKQESEKYILCVYVQAERRVTKCHIFYTEQIF